MLAAGLTLIAIAGGLFVFSPMLIPYVPQLGTQVACIGSNVNTVFFGTYCLGFVLTLAMATALVLGSFGFIALVIPDDAGGAEDGS